VLEELVFVRSEPIGFFGGDFGDGSDGAMANRRVVFRDTVKEFVE